MAEIMGGTLKAVGKKTASDGITTTTISTAAAKFTVQIKSRYVYVYAFLSSSAGHAT